MTTTPNQEANITESSTLTVKLMITIVAMLVAGAGASITAVIAYQAARYEDKKESKDGRDEILRVLNDIRVTEATYRLTTDGAIKNITEALAVIDKKQVKMEGDRWSIDQETENAARNAIYNPGVRYADPKNPGEYFFVDPPTR